MATVGYLLHNELPMLFAIAYGFMALFLTFFLFVQQIRQIAYGHTFNESVNRSRYLYMNHDGTGRSVYDQGVLRNFLEFFGVIDPNRMTAKEAEYALKA